MKEKNKTIKYLSKEPYILEIDNMRIEMAYSDNGKSFKTCMLNILKRKYQKGAS